MITATCVAGLQHRHVGHQEAPSSSDWSSFCEQENWVQSWADEFEGHHLDHETWNVITSNPENEDSSAPVSSLSATACRSAACHRKNVFVANGSLTLLTEKHASGFSTGAVTTQGLKSWADRPYRMCISAKLPGGGDGQGIWPAHWMLPDNGYSDKCLDEGEVDIMEMINGDKDVWSTFHWMSSWPQQKCADFNTYHKSVNQKTSMPATCFSEYNEYAIERTANHIAWAVNGQVVLVVDAAHEGIALSHTPFFLTLNTAVGGAWPGEPSTSTHLPTEHKIDYVRVAHWSGQSEVPLPSASAGARSGGSDWADNNDLTHGFEQAASHSSHGSTSGPPPLSVEMFSKVKATHNKLGRS